MCLYPKLILNKRYCPTKKNGGIVPPCPDNRLKYVTAACGQCYEWMLEGRKLDIDEQRLLKEWIYGGLLGLS